MRRHGEFRVAASFPKRVDEPFGFNERNDLILGAMKGPNRDLPQSGDPFGKSMKPESAAAYRSNRREALRPKRPQIPASESTHTESGQIDTPGIDWQIRKALKRAIGPAIPPARATRSSWDTAAR